MGSVSIINNAELNSIVLCCLRLAERIMGIQCTCFQGLFFCASLCLSGSHTLFGSHASFSVACEAKQHIGITLSGDSLSVHLSVR